MKVYFAGTIVGDRRYRSAYQTLVEHIQASGHTVPTVHVAHEHVLEDEAALTPKEVYERDVGWIRESDCLVAEVSTASLGVGYEVCYALGHGKPVLCLYRSGGRLSKMISGCSEPGISVRDYETVRHALDLIDAFLENIGAHAEKEP